MKNYITACFLGVSLSLPAQKHFDISFDSPPDKLSMLGENVISTSINERDFALSPDGNEIFFTISTPKSSFQTIVYCRKEKQGSWTSPVVAPFAGQFSDLEPAFTPDGNTLFFSSNRPLTGNSAKDFDIWKVTRVGSSWGTPENVGLPINTTADEFYPSVTKYGNLYFTAAYEGGVGKEDIYISIFKNGAYLNPTALDTAVNSRFYEFNSFVSPDENYILFTSYGRKDDTGGGDLYISLKNAEGKWQTARNLKELNSRQLDYCPFVSPDGKSLFITSERHQLPVSFNNSKATYRNVVDIVQSPLNGTGNLYWIDFRKVLTR